jgi:regulator of protease activity HflC (stomatin/prohibitin superfamily)
VRIEYGTGNGSSAGDRRGGVIRGAAIVLIVVGLIVTFAVAKTGCVNLHTPPGHEGYIRSNPIAGQGSFTGIQHGPTSTGFVWRQVLVNIDMRPATYSEEMSIVTAERLPLSFKAHTRIQLRAGSVREVVEKYGGADWYATNVREQLRSEVRSKVQALDAFTVAKQSGTIAEQVLAAMQARYKTSPIEVLSVDIGDIQYPEVVVQSVVRKFVTEEDNLRKDIELKIAQREIDIGIADAEGTADAQRIIRTTLDPMFLQYEALSAIEQLAGAPNTTFVVMPMGNGRGAAPIMLNMEGK